MKISKQLLIEMDACQGGLDRFIEQTGNTDEPVEVLSLIGGKNISSDLTWLASETLPKEKIVRFTCAARAACAACAACADTAVATAASAGTPQEQINELIVKLFED